MRFIFLPYSPLYTSTLDKKPTGTLLSDKNNISAIAQQALKEAQERRQLAQNQELEKEFNGRKGPNPTRYGDWENKGIISDF